jgi:hypothetical protein
MGGDTTKNYNYKTSEGTSSWKNGWQQSSPTTREKVTFSNCYQESSFRARVTNKGLFESPHIVLSND